MNLSKSQKKKLKKIICLAYQQGKVFQKCEENVNFTEMVRQFAYSKTTIIFKMNILKLINKHSKSRGEWSNLG